MHNHISKKSSKKLSAPFVAAARAAELKKAEEAQAAWEAAMEAKFAQARVEQAAAASRFAAAVALGAKSKVVSNLRTGEHPMSLKGKGWVKKADGYESIFSGEIRVLAGPSGPAVILVWVEQDGPGRPYTNWCSAL